MGLVWSQDIIYYERSTDLYCNSYRYNYRYDTMTEICIWCNIEREEVYMGGGVTRYICPKCNCESESKI